MSLRTPTQEIQMKFNISCISCALNLSNKSDKNDKHCQNLKKYKIMQFRIGKNVYFGDSYIKIAVSIDSSLTMSLFVLYGHSVGVRRVCSTAYPVKVWV